MVKIYIYAGGKNKRDWAVPGIEHYIKLLKPYAEVSIEYYPGGARSKESPASFINRIPSSIPIVFLDEHGKQFHTVQFARFFTNLTQSEGKIAFALGNHAGFSNEIVSQAEYVISFSEMTFGHRLSLIILLEQIYRTFDLSSGGKYSR
ncbi:MAG: hypothetical protein GF315_13585 [candidate division Zixibacteria bacterium]|nr:hypothetical protein [candidate division Zixibacteria bacterium]